MLGMNREESLFRARLHGYRVEFWIGFLNHQWVGLSSQDPQHSGSFTCTKDTSFLLVLKGFTCRVKRRELRVGNQLCNRYNAGNITCTLSSKASSQWPWKSCYEAILPYWGGKRVMWFPKAMQLLPLWSCHWNPGVLNFRALRRSSWLQRKEHWPRCLETWVWMSLLLAGALGTAAAPICAIVSLALQCGCWRRWAARSSYGF